jgi:uncharacterized protein (TIGR02246 family)
MKNGRRDLFATAIILLLSTAPAMVSPVSAATHPNAAPSKAADSASTANCAQLTDSEVAGLFSKWNLALASLDPKQVAGLYWQDAVLLPTVSNIPRTNSAAIEDYFVHFLQKFPRGVILSRTIYHACNLALDMGLYDFSVLDSAGNISLVHARYSFAYTYRDGGWRIQHHHSSAMPEPVETPQSATEHPTQQAHHDAPAATPTHEGSNAAKPVAPAAHNSEPAQPPTLAAARLVLYSASRTPSAMLSAEQRQKVGDATVGVKVCGHGIDGQRSFELSDPAPESEANETALAWAREARWQVSGTPDGADPVCTQIVVRFSDAGG